MTEFNTPSHYVLSDGSDSMDALAKILGLEEFKGFLRGNALKYLIRYAQKGGIEDLKKAMDYVKRLAAVVETEKKSTSEEREKTIAEKLYDACKKYRLLLNVDYKWEKMRNGDPVPMSAELTIAYDDEVFFAVRLDKEKTWCFIDDPLENIPRPIAEELMKICTAYGKTPIKDRGDLFSFFN